MHAHVATRLRVIAITLAIVPGVFACNAMLGVDTVTPLPPDATGPTQQSPDGGLSQPGPSDAPPVPPPDAPPAPPDAPPSVNCRIASHIARIVSAPGTSFLVHRDFDGGTSLFFQLNDDPRPDAFQVDLYNGEGGHGTLDTIGAFAVMPQDAQLTSCGLCLLGFTDVIFDGTDRATYFGLSQGTMTITRADGLGLTGHMENLRLRHVDFSSGGQRELNDGCFVDIDQVIFDMQYEPPTASPRTSAIERSVAPLRRP